MQLRKTRNQAKFPTGTKNSNMHCVCCVEIAILLMLLSAHVTSVLFLVQFNNFVLTICFFWSYTLLLKLPVLMCSWHATRLDVGRSGSGPTLCLGNSTHSTVHIHYSANIVYIALVPVSDGSTEQ